MQLNSLLPSYHPDPRSSDHQISNPTKIVEILNSADPGSADPGSAETGSAGTGAVMRS